METPDKQTIDKTLKSVLADRPFIFLIVGLIVAGLVYSVLLGLSIQPSDVTVYTRYTAFGEAHFYKSPWQYLFLFLIFGAVVVAGHTAIMLKLHVIERRQTAVLIGWIGIAILLIAVVYALSVIRLGQAV